MAQVQSWQRDPLIADLVAAHRRERHRNPTSEGWIALPTTGPRASSPGRRPNGADGMEPHPSEVSYA